MTKKIAANLFQKPNSATQNAAAQPFDAAQFSRVLAAWFETSQRDLPWRRAENARDAYRVLVSEVMLQQTTVAAVVPFYERFLARFPDVETLAAASLEDVLPLWAGLGYYRRARMLHACAREIVGKHGGVFPREVPRVLALPGIGRYTAGAVCSIAHEIAAPIVDANVARVFARIFLVEGDVKSSASQQELWKRATQIVESAHENSISPAIINPALMELGALICTPRAPRCEVCPIGKWCGARATNRQNELPFVPPRRAPVELHDVCIFAQSASAHAASTRGENDVENETRDEETASPRASRETRAATKPAKNARDENAASTRVGSECFAAMKSARDEETAAKRRAADSQSASTRDELLAENGDAAPRNFDPLDASTRDEDARVLLRQRPHDADVWWRGMWELPRTTRREGESEEDALRRILEGELGFDAADFSLGAQLRRVKHGVTHHAITLDCYEVSLRDEAPLRAENALWLSWREMDELALPSSMRALATWLRAQKTAAQSVSAQRALW